MRSNTTSNRVICPRDGWLKRVGFSIATLVVMLLVPMTGMAQTYNFWANNTTTALSSNGSFTNSSGENMTLLNGWDGRFGVSGSVGGKQNCWMLYLDNTLYNGCGGARYLSIRNLNQGQKVTISWTQGSGTSNGQAWTSDITFVTTGQADGKKAGDIVPHGEGFWVLGNGTLDLNVGRYVKISQIKIENSQWTNTVTINTNGSSGTMKWDPDQKKMVEAS